MPKRAYNPKSRENLRQYQTVRAKKQKDEIAKSLIKEVNLDEGLLEVIIAAKEVCVGKEEERFMSYVKEYLKEYGKKGTELTISDIDDIATLCMNNVMITRLYKEAKKDGNSVADVMAAVDRLKKDNIKLKENLASTRKDRVDPKAGQILTVNDLLEDYLQHRRVSFEDRKKQYEEEEEEYRDKIKTSVEELIT